MTNFLKYDIVVVKFPFASSFKYKARPAVVISSNYYNDKSRETLLIMAISSKINSKLTFEIVIEDWKGAGLLKESVLKSSIATIEKDYVLTKLGRLSESDIKTLESTIDNIC